MLGVAMLAGALLAAPSHPAAAAAAPDDILDQVIAQQMSTDLDVSLDEANVRVSRHHKYRELLAQLQALPGYAGAVIDNTTDVLHVRSTSDSPAPGPLARELGIEDHVDALPAEYTLDQLSQLDHALVPVLAKLSSNRRSPLTVSYSLDTNRVEVAYPSADPPTDEERATIDDAAAGPAKGALIYNAVDVIGGPTGICSFPSCDPPMRGGLWLSQAANGTAGYCSSGFMATSVVDGSWYAMTAGHCTDGTGGTVGPYWEKQPSDTTTPWHRVGVRHSTDWTSGYDGSLLDFTSSTGGSNAAGWAPSKTVYVLAQNGAYPTTANSAYTIQAVGTSSNLAVNDYLCQTGATSGTTCGQYQSSGNSRTYDGAYISDLAKTTIRTCQGNSGGPVYVSHTGYGLTVYGEGTTSPSQMTGANGGLQTCFGSALFSEVVAIEYDLNVQIY